MFHAEQWAEAFLDICARQQAGASASGAAFDAAYEGLEALKTLSPLILGIKNHVSGISDAQQLDRMLRYSLKQAIKADKSADKSADLSADSFAENPGVEYACRLIFFLVRYGYIHHLTELTAKISDVLNKRRSVLTGILEAAFPVDQIYLDRFKDSLKAKFQVQDVALEVRIVPALLGGCRLRIGSDSWDGTLAKQLQRLEQVLEASSDGGA